MNILGLSCYDHDSAACLVRDGTVVAAAQEERFNRRKNSPDFPHAAIDYCLREGQITVDNVDHVVFYEKPFLKLERVLLSHILSYPRSLRTFLRTMPPWLDDRLVLPLTLSKTLGFDGKVHFISHHLAHAGSSFLASPFEEAAILTADGVGEWATTTLGYGKGTEINLMKELRYPDSLGLIYTAVTTYLGFEALRGEGKVMALADFGAPACLEKFREMIHVRDDGSFRVDRRFFGFHEGDRMYSPDFVNAFGPPRAPGEEISGRHKDIAAGLQRFLEDVLIKMARTLYGMTRSPNLCLAGGVCLNVTATSRILEQTDFTDVFIQPAAGDSGGALGAALFLYHALTGARRGPPMTHAYLGPEFSERQIRRCLAGKRIAFRQVEPGELPAAAARMIADGQIVGWFRGRMEFGPRALGCRSILADPRRPDMKDALNAKVKHREAFRPYGVSILMEDVPAWFETQRPSPFMLQVAQVRKDKRDLVPSAIHVNGTSRLQTLTREENGVFYDVVKAFRDLTGVPMIINTSFNDDGEPIVCAPEDAVACYSKTQMDALFMGNFILEKAASEAAARG